jgi:ethanolamine utilization microcompartment shell protein EutS
MAIVKIQFRRDTTANWTSVNPILHNGEPAYDIDLKVWTVGDGVTRYLDLPKIPIDIVSLISTVVLPDGLISGSDQISGSFVNITGDTMTGDLNVTGDVNISGILTATEFHSDIVSGSIIYESGSTKFGDTADDTHEFTGSVKVQGTISGSFIGDGSGLSGVTSYTDADTLDYINSIAVVSGSVVSSYTDLTNIPAGIISGSSQLDGSTIDNLTITGNGSIEAHTLFVDTSEFRTSFSMINNAGVPTEVATVPTGSYDAFYFDYVIKNGVNLRAGTLIAVHDGVTTNIIDNTTTDLGNTSAIVMSTDLSSGFIRLLAITDSGTWTVKSIIRMI